MVKYSNTEIGKRYAEEHASKSGLLFGWSVFCPGWFVGTAEELRKIGVLL